MPIAATISGLAVNPGTSIWIRWTDIDNAGGEHGLAIDNVSVAATFSSDPTPPRRARPFRRPVSPGQTLAITGTILPG